MKSNKLATPERHLPIALDIKPEPATNGPNVFGVSLLDIKHLTNSGFSFIQGGNGLSAIVKSKRVADLSIIVPDSKPDCSPTLDNVSNGSF